MVYICEVIYTIIQLILKIINGDSKLAVLPMDDQNPKVNYFIKIFS